MPQDNPRHDGVPETCFEGRVFRVTREPLRYPSGRRGNYEVVRHHGAVAVLPILLDPLRVVLLHQYRHPVGGRIWEIPAGTLDLAGESQRDCADRELIEETGYRAERLLQVHDFYTAPGFCDERMALFVAWGLRPASPAEMDSDEVLTVHTPSWNEVRRMLAAGEIQDAKTLVGLRWLEIALRAAGNKLRWKRQ